MPAIVPSPNSFPFTSQEFALVGDTSDVRYPLSTFLKQRHLWMTPSELASTWTWLANKKKQALLTTKSILL